MEVLRVQEIMKTHPDHARYEHDPIYEKGCAFMMDEILPRNELKMPLSDGGFRRGGAVYDAVSVSRGNFFRLEQHQARLARSCELIQVRNPLSREKETEMLHRIVALAGYRDAIVWWTVTMGEAPSGEDFLKPEKYKNRIYGYVDPYSFLFGDDQRVKGINLIVAKRHIQIPPTAVNPHAKNLHWLDFMLSLFEAGERGGNWAVLTNGSGLLTETPGANVFIIKDGTVLTPESGCLEGITRQATIDLCKELDLPCKVTTAPVEELRNADEAFLTSTAGGIMPVSKVDGERVGGKDGPGELTIKLHNEYWERRWNGWDATPVKYELAQSSAV